ncbi:flagellar protein FliS [Sphingomonas sp.]|uniref:flagellar export chaperone FliS n=1 Tax=Sphingomonas sp. TaxID=28214 RepID=UPI0035BC927F
MAYARAFAHDAAATYRRIDVAGRTTGADGPALVQLLYEELVSALRAAAFATERGKGALKSERVTRATAILFALEAGLDFASNPELSGTLSRLYGGARRTVVEASIGHDPTPFRDAATMLEEIATAWRTARAA